MPSLLELAAHVTPDPPWAERWQGIDSKAAGPAPSSSVRLGTAVSTKRELNEGQWSAQRSLPRTRLAQNPRNPPITPILRVGQWAHAIGG